MASYMKTMSIERIAYEIPLYRGCVYNLAMDIGESYNTYSHFMDSIQKHHPESFNEIQSIEVPKNSNERRIATLSVLNELERLGVYSIEIGNFTDLEKILRHAVGKECKDLANNFMDDLKSENLLFNSDISSDGQMKIMPNLCLFLRNENLSQTCKIPSEERILDYLDSKEYKEILEKCGLDVSENNSRLFTQLWESLANTNATTTKIFEYLIIIMIGYIPSGIENKFMMNHEIESKKGLCIYGITAHLVDKLNKWFSSQKIIVVNLTQHLPCDYVPFIDPGLSDNSEQSFPEGLGYIHIHADNSNAMEQLLTQDFTENWVKSPDYLGKLKQNIQSLPNIELINYHNPFNHDPYQIDSAILVENVLRPKDVLMCKIRINEGQTDVVRRFFKHDLVSGNDKRILPSIMYDPDQVNWIPLREHIYEICQDKNYDLFMFVITSKTPVAGTFYNEIVDACCAGLQQSATSKPKIFLIDAEMKQGEILYEPKLQPETFRMCSCIRHEHWEDSVISHLRNLLDEDEHGKYDFKNLLKNSQARAVKDGTYMDDQLNTRIFLTPN